MQHYDHGALEQWDALAHFSSPDAELPEDIRLLANAIDRQHPRSMHDYRIVPLDADTLESLIMHSSEFHLIPAMEPTSVVRAAVRALQSSGTPEVGIHVYLRSGLKTCNFKRGLYASDAPPVAVYTFGMFP